MAKAILGSSGFILISVLIMICTFGATNSSLMSSPRIYYQMAKKNLFFKSFASVHPKYQTPHIALIYQLIWSSILVCTGTFDQLTDMLIFASFIFYGSGALGLIIMKRKGKIKAKVFGYPYVPILFIAFCIGLVANTIITMPRESITGIIFILLGIPVYFLFQRPKTKA